MTSLEGLVQQCVDYAFPIIKEASRKENIMREPLMPEDFPVSFLQFNWEIPLDELLPRDNFDSFINLVLKRIITDALITEGDNEESNENMTVTEASPIIEQLRLCACVLDYCFHSKKNRKSPNLWCVAYFNLFSNIADLLAWPYATLDFWTYPESRIGWFKMGNSLEPLPLGETSLISYKQPLFDKLRHWNELLTKVKQNAHLNTPSDYKMTFKLQKFLSELLPIYEESNFNRSALISNRQNTGNIWNKTISSATRTDSSSENIFATDYNYVFDNILTCPLDFAYKPLEFKLDMDKLLMPLIDAIFDVEGDLYKKLKKSRRKLADINDKLNIGYPLNFEVNSAQPPKYMRISSKIKNERVVYWRDYLQFNSAISLMVQPTLLDISMSNPETLYQQMMNLDNDYYRKQFLMQLYLSVGLIRNILNSKEVESYYRSCYQKEKPSKSIKFENLSEANFKKTQSLCHHIIENRINKFYHSRDPHFFSLLRKLAETDEAFLKSKIEGFKQFQNFTSCKEPLREIAIDNTFKKFGFVRLGNKSINNVWKIDSGLALIDKKALTAKNHFESLRKKWKSSCGTNELSQDDEIIKQWQSLRSLRSKYLFDFKNVNEKVGIYGLFDPSLIQNQANDRELRSKNLKENLRSAHITKLEEARAFMLERRKRKRSFDQENNEEPAKKIIKRNDNGMDEALEHSQAEKNLQGEGNSQVEENFRDGENLQASENPQAIGSSQTTLSSQSLENLQTTSDLKATEKAQDTEKAQAREYAQAAENAQTASPQGGCSTEGTAGQLAKKISGQHQDPETAVKATDIVPL